MLAHIDGPWVLKIVETIHKKKKKSELDAHLPIICACQRWAVPDGPGFDSDSTLAFWFRPRFRLHLRICWSHGSDHSSNLQSTKSEVCNCKLIRINNQVLLEWWDIRIITLQGSDSGSHSSYSDSVPVPVPYHLIYFMTFNITFILQSYMI